MKYNLPEIIGGNYQRFYDCKCRYRVVKGGKGSKKSKTTALWFILHMVMLAEHKPNLLVIRKYFNTHKNSTFAELNWAIDRLGMRELWSVNKSTLTMTFNPTGAVILFRGLDEPLNLASLTVQHGHLCWRWWEEAYEIDKEEDFNLIDEGLRGQIPEGLFKQHTITLNPWSDKHWIKSRFFDKQDPDIFAITTNYTHNEWLDEADLRMYERMKIEQPERYKVAGLGEWGVTGGLVFENITVREITDDEIKTFDNLYYGIDWGIIHPFVFLEVAYNPNTETVYVIGEGYGKGLYNEQSAELVKKYLTGRGVSHRVEIIADSAEKKSIDDYRTKYGLPGTIPASKKPGSRKMLWRWLQERKSIVIDGVRCPKTASEMPLLQFLKAKDGTIQEEIPIIGEDCTFACGYALNRIWIASGDGK
jgi:phage terminase large subunit